MVQCNLEHKINAFILYKKYYPYVLTFMINILQ